MDAELEKDLGSLCQEIKGFSEKVKGFRCMVSHSDGDTTITISIGEMLSAAVFYDMDKEIYNYVQLYFGEASHA